MARHRGADPLSTYGKRADVIVHQHEPLNVETGLAALAEPVTPTDAFYVRGHGPVPPPGNAAWRLRVHGLVERELELSLPTLREAFPEREVTATLQCAGNRRAGLIAVRDIPGEAPWRDAAIGTAGWTGASLADVLAAAGITDARGLHVAFDAPDVSPLADPPQPFGGSIPLDKALSGGVLLAWAMNEVPLPRLHGGPVRVVVPGYIGARSVKWVTRITVQDEPSANYFQAIAYRMLPADTDPQTAGAGAGVPLGPFAVTSAVTDPQPGACAPAGPVTVRGYAVAGDGRLVARVDVSADGGRTWQQAAFDTDPEPGVWRLWRATVDLSGRAGDEVEVVARAWDDSVAVQPDSAADVWNPKGYANNARPRVRLIVAPADSRAHPLAG